MMTFFLRVQNEKGKMSNFIDGEIDEGQHQLW